MSFAEVALYAWVPICLLLFALLKPRHAVIASYLGAWLFLPMASFRIASLPDITKVTISSFAVMLGVAIFDPNKFLGFRFRWFDLPMLAWCLTPFASSMSNGLGWWDGCSAIVQQLALWGAPYFIGRVYFTDWESFRELAIGIFVGGIIYTPLCLFEIRMSPQLHFKIYGYYQHRFLQHVRDGGFRPMVFMQSGLAVGFWMAVTTLMGAWLWVSGALKKIWSVPLAWIVPVMAVTTYLCKAQASVLFLLAGLATLAWIRYCKNALPLYLMMLFIPAYIFLRVSGLWNGQTMVDLAHAVAGEDRAQSIQTRVDAENLLAARAMEAPQPAFGWGRWNPSDPSKVRWRIYDENGKDVAVTDGMWVITLGVAGIVGLTSAVVAILLPPLLLRSRVPSAWWTHPLAAPAAAVAMILVLHMLDNLLNAMLNPIYVMAMGGLSAVGMASAATAGAARPQPGAATRAERQARQVLPLAR